MKKVTSLMDNEINIFGNKIVFKLKRFNVNVNNLDCDLQDALFWNDCYFNIINGYLYITQNSDVYSIIHEGYNLLSYSMFLDILKDSKKFECYKLSKKESKSLLQDNEKGLNV